MKVKDRKVEVEKDRNISLHTTPLHSTLCSVRSIKASLKPLNEERYMLPTVANKLIAVLVEEGYESITLEDLDNEEVTETVLISDDDIFLFETDEEVSILHNFERNDIGIGKLYRHLGVPSSPMDKFYKEKGRDNFKLLSEELDKY